MPTLIRILPGLIALLIFVSCGDDRKSSTTHTADTSAHQTPPDTSVRQQPHVRNEMTDSMLAQIINYYHKEYGGDSVEMNIDRSDTLVEISFTDTVQAPDHYNGTLFIAYVPLVKEANSILTGDLNNDGLSDKLVSIHTEGGGGGGNAWWTDHFLFLTGSSGENTLANVKSDGELTGGGYGYFFPKEIAAQTITGVGNFYADSDGHCCPSLYYRMHVRLVDGQLTATDKTAIPKPADFD